MRTIETLREGDHVSEIYLCKNKVNAKTKKGKTYYSLTLQDRTGSVDGKIWDLSSGIDHFDSLDYIHIEADVTLYQGSLQLNIRRARLAREGEYNPADYLPVSPFDRKDMAQRLVALIRSVEDPHYKALLSAFFMEDRVFAGEKTRSSIKKAERSAL